ncbi:MAG TPA: NlpC/P60 family protein [Chthoniobacterales bacterium]|nr:NlpC/P60 family protein [Chthoniobacterales bacterium]
MRILCTLLVIALVSGGAANARAEESFGNKLKKIFAPTPTPTPRKTKKKATATKSATPKPTASPEKSPSPKKKATPSPTPTAKEEPSVSPSPKKKKSSPSPSPSPEVSPSPSPKKKKRKTSPTPSPSPTESASPSPSLSVTPEANGTPTPASSASPSPSPKKKGAPATISASEISGYENYSEQVRKITETALELTTRNLDYKYGSADPAQGGMDCSGFIFYVLSQNGVRDVPRDSSQQYVWLRKAGNFKAVNSRNENTFELDELVPGDLLFWTGTYAIERDPPITHAMIYLGRKKGTNQRIMVGASDGRTYEGESRYGVSIFDFKIPKPAKTNEGRMSPSFIGYGRIPGL